MEHIFQNTDLVRVIYKKIRVSQSCVYNNTGCCNSRRSRRGAFGNSKRNEKNLPPLFCKSAFHPRCFQSIPHTRQYPPLLFGVVYGGGSLVWSMSALILQSTPVVLHCVTCNSSRHCHFIIGRTSVSDFACWGQMRAGDDLCVNKLESHPTEYFDTCR